MVHVAANSLGPCKEAALRNGAFGSVTGCDEFIIAEALAPVLVRLNNCRPVPQSTRNIADMKTKVIEGNSWESLPRECHFGECQLLSDSRSMARTLLKTYWLGKLRSAQCNASCFSPSVLVSETARDLDGRYADSPLHDGFNHLASGRGLCCS